MTAEWVTAFAAVGTLVMVAATAAAALVRMPPDTSMFDAMERR
jgi:hypothetical protein